MDARVHCRSAARCRFDGNLSFDDDAAVSGQGGCNQFFGDYQVEGDSISFGPLGSTLMSCGEQLDQQEFAYLSALQEAETYQMSSDRLEITYPTGVLAFAASASGG